MAEIWGAAIMVAGGIASGIAAEKKAKADRKANQQDKQVDYAKVAQQTGYEAALDDYYKQKDRFDTQRGLDQYRSFSTINNYAPDAPKFDGQLTAPVMPDYKSFEVAPNAASQSSSGGKGGVPDIIKKLDPVGSKILGGLF